MFGDLCDDIGATWITHTRSPSAEQLICSHSSSCSLYCPLPRDLTYSQGLGWGHLWRPFFSCHPQADPLMCHPSSKPFYLQGSHSLVPLTTWHSTGWLTSDPSSWLRPPHRHCWVAVQLHHHLPECPAQCWPIARLILQICPSNLAGDVGRQSFLPHFPNRTQQLRDIKFLS